MNKEYLQKKLGPTLHDAMHDESVTEIMLNADGNLWMQKNGVIECVSSGWSSQQADTIVQAIAQHSGLYINAENPSLICSLPYDNSRISISIPPMTTGI